MPNSPVEVRSEVVPFMTEERLALQEMARDFAMREVLLIADELDPVAGEIPMELRRKMADLGFFGILVPEEYGGLGLGPVGVRGDRRGVGARLDERRQPDRPRPAVHRRLRRRAAT